MRRRSVANGLFIACPWRDFNVPRSGQGVNFDFEACLRQVARPHDCNGISSKRIVPYAVTTHLKIMEKQICIRSAFIKESSTFIICKAKKPGMYTCVPLPFTVVPCACSKSNYMMNNHGTKRKEKRKRRKGNGNRNSIPTRSTINLVIAVKLLKNQMQEQVHGQLRAGLLTASTVFKDADGVAVVVLSLQQIVQEQICAGARKHHAARAGFDVEDADLV